MTLNERLAMIDKKVADDKAKQLSAEEAERLAVKEMTDKIKNLSHEIWELIELANACHANGIEIPTNSNHNGLKKYGYDYDAMADGFYHGVGFMRNHFEGNIEYVGYYNGGVCGPWDFYADGVIVFCRNEYEHNLIKEADSVECKKFLTMFPRFRDAFYKWFDTEIGGMSNGN